MHFMSGALESRADAWSLIYKAAGIL